MPPRVDFYVLEEASDTARLRFVCRLAEKIWLQSHKICIATATLEEAQALDSLLWTFRDPAFVPHELATPASKASDDAPILIATEALPDAGCQVLINLKDEVPAEFERFERIAEPIDGEPNRRKRGRERFKHYRDRGITPESHTVA